MNLEKLKPYPNTNFICDNCQREFRGKTAHSPALNLSEEEECTTYCANCIETTQKTPDKSKNFKKNWGAAPLDEVSENTKSLEIDKRTLRKTGRTLLFGTRVKQEWIAKLKSIAYEERLHYNETLEKALECYDKHRRK